MNIEIFLKENEKLVNISDGKFIYQTFENEYGEYYELEGQIIFTFGDKNILTVDTKSLESDIYSFVYSLNDYFDLGFAGITFNNEEVIIKYYKLEEGNLSIEIDDKKCVIIENDFFLNLLNVGAVFFEKIHSLYSNSNHKMYLQIISSLKNRVLLKD